MPQRYYLLKTLGCKANLYDSQRIEADLQARGWLPSDGRGAVDLCVVNSCTVTDEADRQSRKLAVRLAARNPEAQVVFTGCGAEVDPEGILTEPRIHWVIGNQDKSRFAELLDRVEPGGSGKLGAVQNYSGLQSRHPMDREWPLPESAFLAPPVALQGESGRTRAFLKIQEGCNSFCTFCIIPYGRGPSRSLATDGVVEQVKALVDQGVREVVVTGTNVGDYGTDWDPSSGKKAHRLEELFSRILGETRLERLRVSSLDPTEITSGLLSLMRDNPGFCPHFHVSLQSPHSRILKLMKRGYGWDEVKACLQAIDQVSGQGLAEVFVGMDVITGFPGETDLDFDWTLQALKDVPWSRLHVFPYSERKGTPATRLPGSVPPVIRAARAKALRELSLDRLLGLHRKVLERARTGLPLEGVLLEGRVRGPSSRPWVSGYTPNYLRCLVPEEQLGKEDDWRNHVIRFLPGDLVQDRASGDVSFVGHRIY